MIHVWTVTSEVRDNVRVAIRNFQIIVLLADLFDLLDKPFLSDILRSSHRPF